MSGHNDSITFVNKPQQRQETCLRIDVEFKKGGFAKRKVRPNSLYIVTYMTEAHRTMIIFSLERSVAFESLISKHSICKLAMRYCVNDVRKGRQFLRCPMYRPAIPTAPKCGRTHFGAGTQVLVI